MTLIGPLSTGHDCVAGLGKTGKIFYNVGNVSFATMIFEWKPGKAPRSGSDLETVKMGNFVTWEKNWFRSGSKLI